MQWLLSLRLLRAEVMAMRCRAGGVGRSDAGGVSEFDGSAASVFPAWKTCCVSKHVRKG